MLRLDGRIILKLIILEGVSYTGLIQESEKWWTVFKAVKKLGVP
jgi:hypothetical protein